MLVAAGNINDRYEVVGIVHAVVTRKAEKGGCGDNKGLPIQKAYEDALKSLKLAAEQSGANGLIHVQYDYRLSTVALGCAQNTEPLFEVYAWGTAVKLQ